MNIDRKIDGDFIAETISRLESIKSVMDSCKDRVCDLETKATRICGTRFAERDFSEISYQVSQAIGELETLVLGNLQKTIWSEDIIEEPSLGKEVA